MPTKLKVLMGMFVVSGVIDALAGHWLLAAYCLLVCLGVASGHEGVRTLLRMLSGAGTFLYIGLGVLTVVAAIAGGLGLAQFLLIASLAAFGGLISGFSYWCLGADDVQHWMYERSMSEIA